MPSRRENDPVAEYLDRLRATLEGLPAFERDEAYREMAQHVESLVNDEVIAGDDKDEAVRSALQRFGEPEEMANKVVKDYWRRAFSLDQVFQSGAPEAAKRFRLVILGMVATAVCIDIGLLTVMFCHLSGAPVILLGAISGMPLGVGAGRYRADANARKWANRPKNLRWKRWIRENFVSFVMALAAVLLLAVVLELHSSNSRRLKQPLVFGTTMLLSEVVTILISQRIFTWRKVRAGANE